jgi:hypothetical protein
MKSHIQHDVNLHNLFKENLISEYPDLDDETLFDTLEGLTSLNEKLAEIVRSQQEDRVLCVALKQRIDEMRERYQRLETRISNKRKLVSTAMEQAQIRKIVESDFTVSLRATSDKLVVNNEDFIPDEFWIQQPPKLDRTSLTEALKANPSIAGVHFEAGDPTISVRVK